MIQAFPLYFEMLNLEPHFLFIPFVCVVWWGFFGFVLGLGLFSVDFFFFFFLYDLFLLLAVVFLSQRTASSSSLLPPLSEEAVLGAGGGPCVPWAAALTRGSPTLPHTPPPPGGGGGRCGAGTGTGAGAGRGGLPGLAAPGRPRPRGGGGGSGSAGAALAAHSTLARARRSCRLPGRPGRRRHHEHRHAVQEQAGQPRWGGGGHPRPLLPRGPPHPSRLTLLFFSLPRCRLPPRASRPRRSALAEEKQVGGLAMAGPGPGPARSELLPAVMRQPWGGVQLPGLSALGLGTLALF